MAFYVEGQIRTCVAFSDREVLELLDGAKLVIIERFATSGRISSYGLQTVELVGAIKGWCWSRGVDFHLSTPTQRYPQMGVAEQAVGSIITPSKFAKHEVDALAHLLAYCLREERGLL